MSQKRKVNFHWSKGRKFVSGNFEFNPPAYFEANGGKIVLNYVGVSVVFHSVFKLQKQVKMISEKDEGSSIQALHVNFLILCRIPFDRTF